MKRTKKQTAMFVIGLLMMLAGLSILGFYGGRRILRDIHRNQLMKENMVISIPELHIKAPVLEGTDNEVLRQAVGHFPQTGTPGHGNCCIAGHSSAIYKEYFNAIKKVKMGMTIYLYDKEKREYAYTVTEYRIPSSGVSFSNTESGMPRLFMAFVRSMTGMTAPTVL